MPQINLATAFEDTGVTLMDRIYGNAGTAITQATISSIAFKCYEHATKDKAVDAEDGTLITSGAIVVASTVFDTLQTDAKWTRDSTGYNFAYASPAADRTVGARWHRYEIVFTPSSGAVFVVVWVVETLPMGGS
jgi:hypothetical protein